MRSAIALMLLMVSPVLARAQVAQLPLDPAFTPVVLSTDPKDHYPSVWTDGQDPSVTWSRDIPMREIWRFHPGINGGNPFKLSWNVWSASFTWHQPTWRHDLTYPNTLARPRRPDHAGDLVVYEDALFGDYDIFSTRIDLSGGPYDEHLVFTEAGNCGGEYFHYDDDVYPSVTENGLIAYQRFSCDSFWTNFSWTVFVAKVDPTNIPASHWDGAFRPWVVGEEFIRPAIWENYVAYEHHVGYGPGRVFAVELAYVVPDPLFANATWNEFNVSDGTFAARAPHVHDYRVVYEREGVNSQCNMSAGVFQRTFDASGQMLTPETQVADPGTCSNYRRPRVGGPGGRFVLYLGEHCDHGSGIVPAELYLTDLSTGVAYLVGDVLAAPESEPTEYDIYDSYIVYTNVNGIQLIKHGL